MPVQPENYRPITLTSTIIKVFEITHTVSACFRSWKELSSIEKPAWLQKRLQLSVWALIPLRRYSCQCQLWFWYWCGLPGLCKSFWRGRPQSTPKKGFSLWNSWQTLWLDCFFSQGSLSMCNVGWYQVIPSSCCKLSAARHSLRTNSFYSSTTLNLMWNIQR